MTVSGLISSSGSALVSLFLKPNCSVPDINQPGRVRGLLLISQNRHYRTQFCLICDNVDSHLDSRSITLQIYQLNTRQKYRSITRHESIIPCDSWRKVHRCYEAIDINQSPGLRRLILISEQEQSPIHSFPSGVSVPSSRM